MSRVRRSLVAAVAVGAVVVGAGLPSAAAPRAADKVAKPKRAPAALTALALINRSKLHAALKATVSPVQDNGGYALTDYNSGKPAFASSAEVETTYTTYTSTLTTYSSVKAAKQAYVGMRGPGTTAVKHVGDQAAHLDQTMTVRTGTQVVQVITAPTLAGDNYIAQNDKSPASEDFVLYGPALLEGSALGKHLSGKAKPGAYSELPQGAFNPCVVTAKQLTKQTKQASSLQPGPSDDAPFQQCNASAGPTAFFFQTYTRQQSKTAISHGGPAKVYASDLALAGGRPVKKVTVGPLQYFMFLDEDWQVDVLVNAPTSKTSSTFKADAAGTFTSGGLALGRIQNPITDKVPRRICLEAGDSLLSVMLSHLDEDYKEKRLAQWQKDNDQEMTAMCSLLAAREKK